MFEHSTLDPQIREVLVSCDGLSIEDAVQRLRKMPACDIATLDWLRIVTVSDPSHLQLTRLGWLYIQEVVCCSRHSSGMEQPSVQTPCITEMA